MVEETQNFIWALIIGGGMVFLTLTFSVRHLNAIRSTANRGCSGIKPLPALQHM
jgi:hypothetical protein